MEVQRFIGSNLRVSVADGRVLDGVLSAVDPFGNILLSNVREISVDKFNPGRYHSRELGLISVPRKEIKTIKIDKTQLRHLDITEVADIESLAVSQGP